MLTAACLVGLVIAPLRVAVVCLLVSSHLNLTSLDAGGAAVGLLNALRIIIFPIILYSRLLFKNRSRLNVKNSGFWIWIVFCLYAAASILWLKVDNLVPYLKQLGYLYTYLITYIVLCKSFHNNVLREKEIIYSFVIATFIAILQTYWLGNLFGSTLNWSRFVSFTAKQQFAE
ncbi:MAG: hypothetical protein KJO81_13490 [Gammaproteobacteria bacterium]|nr:hypothetical protein [Gammaproteobacteria bacterium]